MICLDVPNCRGVDSEVSRDPLLREPECPPRSSHSLSECIPLWGRVIADEADDRRQVPEVWLMPTDFPVLEGLRRDADLRGRLPLQESKIEPSLPEMITNGNKLGWIRRIRRYRGGKTEAARRD